MYIKAASVACLVAAISGCQTTTDSASMTNEPSAVETASYNVIPYETCVNIDRRSHNGDRLDMAFRNDFPFDVELIWLDKKGKPRLPGDLIKAGATFNQYTFRTHAFYFSHAETGECVAIHRIDGTEANKTIAVPSQVNGV